MKKGRIIIYIVFLIVITVVFSSCNSSQRAIKNSDNMVRLMAKIEETDTITKRQIKLYKKLLRRENTLQILVNDSPSGYNLQKLLYQNNLPFRINKNKTD